MMTTIKDMQARDCGFKETGVGYNMSCKCWGSMGQFWRLIWSGRGQHSELMWNTHKHTPSHSFQQLSKEYYWEISSEHCLTRSNVKQIFFDCFYCHLFLKMPTTLIHTQHNSFSQVILSLCNHSNNNKKGNIILSLALRNCHSASVSKDSDILKCGNKWGFLNPFQQYISVSVLQLL